MRFEVCIKYGNRWSYKGIYSANTSRAAALDASYSWNRKVIRVRPEDSRDKWLVYRFQYVGTLTSSSGV
jgi:hypothetical protein